MGEPTEKDNCIEYWLKYAWYYYLYKPINDRSNSACGRGS